MTDVKNKRESRKQKISLETEEKVQSVATRHKRELYAENPFLDFSITAKKRSVTVSKGTVLESTEENEPDKFETTIQQVKLVDESQFVKIFTEQVKALFGLSPAGIKVFGLLLQEQQKHIAGDCLFFNVKTATTLAEKCDTPFSASTYTRGVNDLIIAKIIAASDKGLGWFYINPAVVFNGDRARFVTEIRKTRQDKINQNQMALPYSDE